MRQCLSGSASKACQSVGPDVKDSIRGMFPLRTLSRSYDPLAAEHAQPCSFLHCYVALMQPSPHGWPFWQILQHCCGASAVDIGNGVMAGAWSARASR
jgi:hypothetical protein